jgi:hypothetical protein
MLVEALEMLDAEMKKPAPTPAAHAPHADCLFCTPAG